MVPAAYFLLPAFYNDIQPAAKLKKNQAGNILSNCKGAILCAYKKLRYIM